MYVYRNIEARSYNHCCSGKATSITYSGCVCLQSACAVLSSVACLAVQFSTLPHKQHDFQKKKLLNIKYVLNFSTTFAWNISHCIENSARYCRKCTQVFMYSTVRWFPRLQVATKCISCSPPDLNFVDTKFIFMYTHYNHCQRATVHLQLNILLLLLLSRYNETLNFSNIF
jgi:hypothetical protein